MRLIKENISKYLTNNRLNLYNNQEITHIDYIPDNIKNISISHTNVEEITCELPEGLKLFYCRGSKLRSLPLLPKSLECLNSKLSKLPKEFRVYIHNDNIQCNRLRKLQLLELI